MASEEIPAHARPAPGAGERPPAELRGGAVGFGGILFQSITFMAPAIATAFSIPIGMSFGGGATPLAVILALVASLFVASSIAQLAKHMPSAGSFYTYVSNSIHPGLGFLVGWAFELALLIGGVFLATQIGIIVSGTLNTEFGVPTSTWWIWMVLGSLLVFTLGYFGIRASTRAGVVLGAFEILVILALAITLIAKAGSHNTLSVFGTHFANNPKYRGFPGIIAASIFSILAFIGFEEAAPLAEEAHEPRRHVRIAVLLSCLAVGVFYVINTYASTVFFGPRRMLGFVSVGSSNPWQNVLARDAWGAAGFVIVFLALLNSVIANQSAANNSSTRNLFAMGRIRLLPRSFALLTKRFGSPYVGLGAQLLITVGVSLWLGEQYGPYTAFALTATIIVDVFVPLYILLNLACIVYYARFHRAEFNWLLHGLIPVLGIAAFVPAFFAGAGIPVFSFITPLSKPLSYAGPAVGAWVLLGLIYLAYLYARHPQRVVETRRVFIGEEPPPVGAGSGRSGGTPETTS
jgi:amino acid transporter